VVRSKRRDLLGSVKITSINTEMTEATEIKTTKRNFIHLNEIRRTIGHPECVGRRDNKPNIYFVRRAMPFVFT